MSFEETLNFFGKMLNNRPPEKEMLLGEVTLEVDKIHILLKKGALEGSFQIEMDLGFFLLKPKISQLQTLMKSQFLGVDTGGGTFSLDDSGTTLSLRITTSPGTSPQENWDWLHRSLFIYRHWSLELSKWKEFTPLISEIGNKDDKNYPIHKDLRA